MRARLIIAALLGLTACPEEDPLRRSGPDAAEARDAALDDTGDGADTGAADADLGIPDIGGEDVGLLDGGEDGGLGDGGSPADAEVRTDGGDASDVGVGPDLGGADAGGFEDAGGSGDVGGPDDGGGSGDAGGPVDGGGSSDGGGGDGGGPSDGGPADGGPVDAGGPIDGGGALDGGPMSDAGSVDAGTGCRTPMDCDSSEVCYRPEGACSQVGVCWPRPTSCPRTFDPVCGCDGQMYQNACFALRAGQSVASRGTCR